MGCGSSSASGDPIRDKPAIVHPESLAQPSNSAPSDGRSPLQSPMPAASGKAPKTVTTPTEPESRGAISQLDVSSTTPAWQAEGDTIPSGAVNDRSDEIVNGNSVLLGSVPAADAAVVPRTSSHLDHTTDEILDVGSIPTATDAIEGSAGSATGAANIAASAAPAPTGGSWAASKRLEGKLEFSAQQVGHKTYASIVRA